MHVMTFGPQGTFCHLMAQELTLDIELLSTLSAVCETLSRTEGAYALLPIENSTSGPILDSWAGIERYGFAIVAEYEREIGYSLAGWTNPQEATILFAHPHAFKQCKERLASLCPQAKLILAPSNAAAAISLLENKPGAIALVSPEIAQIYQLPVQRERIEDRPDNKTRFALVRKSKDCTYS